MSLIRPRFSQLNTIVTTIDDPMTVLNKSSTVANLDVGFIINRDGGTNSNLAIIWDQTANNFAFGFTTASGVTNANVSIGTYANTRVGTLFADSASIDGITNLDFAILNGDGTDSGVNYLTVKGNVVLNTYGSSLRIEPANGDAKLIVGSRTNNTNPSITIGNPLSTGGNPTSATLNFGTGVSGTAAYISYTNSSQILDIHHNSLNGNIDFNTYSSVDNGLKLSIGGEQGNVKVYSTASSTSTSTGAFVVAGGAGIAGNVHTGDLTTTGVYTNNYYYANGTPVSFGYGNTQVAAYLPTHTGNISAGNVIAGTLYGNIGGGSTLANIYVTGSLIPNANVTYDLGTPTQRWRDGWFSGTTIHIGSESLSVDNNGKWTFTSKGSAVELGKETEFNPPTANISGNVTASNFYFSNGTALTSLVSSEISSANTALKGYADTAIFGNISTVNSKVDGANSAIVTANTAMKGYVDSTITSVGARIDGANTAIISANTTMKLYVDETSFGNISSVTSKIDGANSAIVTANTAMKGYVDNSISTVNSKVDGANSAIVTANTAMKGYVDNSISTVNSKIDGANSAVVTANTAMKGYVDSTVSANVLAVNSKVDGANSAVVTANTALKGYVDAELSTLTSNAGAQAASITDLYSNKANISSPTFSGLVTITGNLNVTGNVTSFSSNNLTLNDSLIYLAHDNTGDVLDIGFVSSYTKNSVYQHGGLVRDASDDVWKLFGNVVTEPTTIIDFTGAQWATLQTGALNAKGTINVGSGTTDGILTSYSTQNLVLTTNGGTVNDPKITLSQSDDGNITLDPSGTGVSKVLSTLFVGSGSAAANIASLGAYDLWLSTNQNVGRAYIKLSSSTNGNIDFGLNGTGTINVPKITFADNSTLSSATISEIIDGSGSSVDVNGNITATIDNNGVAVVYSEGIDVTGNVNANYFIGDGSLLTGIASGYGNAEVASYLPTHSGNISGANINVTATTTSTSSTTGALQVAGGVGIQGNLFVGDRPSKINVGGSGNGLEFTSTSGGNFVTTIGTDLTIASGGTSPDISGTAGIISRNLGAIVGSGLDLYGGSSNINLRTGNSNSVIVTSTLASTSSTTGALRVAGGAGIAGNLNVGSVGEQKLTVYTAQGNISIGNVTTANTINTDAGITFNGGQQIISGIFTEVNGNILSYGINMNQVTTADTAAAGGIFRLDVRTAQRKFVVVRRPAGSSTETEEFEIALDTGFARFNSNVLVGRTATAFSNLTVAHTTTSTSTTTGALQVAGGVGIAGNTYIGGRLIVNSSLADPFNITAGTHTLQFTSDGSIEITRTGGGAYIDFKGGSVDYDTRIQSVGNGASASLSFSTNTAERVSIDPNGNVLIGVPNTNTFSNLYVGYTTTSTSSTTGALRVAGGVGVAGNVYTGGIVDITSTAASTSTSTGALIVDGGAGIAGNVNAGNVTATNLTGTLLTAAQTNITSVGTLGSLSVTGNVSAANLVSSFGLWGTVRTAAQSSITSVGTLTSLAVSNGLAATFAVTANSSTFTDTVSTSTTNKVLRVINNAQDLHFNANLGQGSYNNLVAAQDAGIIFSNGTQGQGNLTIGPWISGTSGIRIVGNTGQVTVPGFLNINSNNNATAIVNGGTNGTGNIGASGAGFNTVFAKSTSAQYADLAEIYTSDRDYVPGTVVIFGGEKEVTVSTESHDPRVAGVVSTNPAYLMNNSCDGVEVALQGRVPCKVIGPIEKGDRLVTSSTQGAAQRLSMSYYQPGCIIGKALQSVPEGEIATIEVVVGRV